MPLLTPEDIAALGLESDLPRARLETVVAAIEQEIVSRFGGHASQTDVIEDDGAVVIHASRSVASVSSVVELVAETSTTLAADDYRLVGKRSLERRPAGTNPRPSWGRRVTLTYEPVDETALRKLVLVELAMLDVRFSGVASESDGGFSEAQADYRRERERVMARLARESRMFA